MRIRLKSGIHKDRNGKTYKKGDVMKVDSLEDIPELFRPRWEVIPEKQKEVVVSEPPKPVAKKTVKKEAAKPLEVPKTTKRTSKRTASVKIQDKSQNDTEDAE